MRAIPARILLTILALALCCLIAAPAAAFAEASPPPPPPAASANVVPGVAQGSGTRFAVTESAWLDVVLETEVPVDALVESFPEMVTIHLEASGEEIATQMRLSGLAPSTGYWMYVDDYDSAIPIVADASGVAAFPVDLTTPHVLFVQPVPSTIHLTGSGWSDPSVGTWDPIGRVARLTRDVTETISIDTNNVTLDGGGRQMALGSAVNAVYASGRSNVTVRSLSVTGAQRAVYLYSCTGSLVSDVSASGSTNAGIALERTSGTRVEDCSVVGGRDGVTLVKTSACAMRRCESSVNSYSGVRTDGSTGDELSDSVVSGNAGYGMLLAGFTSGRVERNAVRDNGVWDVCPQTPDPAGLNVFAANTGSGGLPIAYYAGTVSLHDAGPFAELILVDADLSVVDGVTVRGSAAKRNNGIYAFRTNDATFRRVDSRDNAFGLYLDDSDRNRVEDSSFTSASTQGVGLWLARGNTIAGSTFTQCTTGIAARLMSDDNVVEGNTLTDNKLGVGSWASTSRNRWTGNTFTGNDLAIQCGDTGGVVSGNTVSGGSGCSLLDAVASTFEDNEVMGATIGINVARSRDCVVRRNTLSDGKYGLELYNATGNRVYSNDFLRNTYPAYLVQASGNLLNEPRPVGGNHWDVWTAPDADEDGFVDQPFVLGAVTDFLPLARPFHSPADATAPMTSVSLDPVEPDGTAGWYVTQPMVTLTADDGEGSGVALTEYSVDGEVWTTYAAPFEAPEGEYTLLVRSTDAEGNVETPHALPLRVDATAPVLDLDATSLTVDEGVSAVNAGTASDTAGPVTLTASAGEISFDAGDGGWTWRMYAADGPALHRVTVTAEDGHGNATTRSFDADVRNVAPAVSPHDAVLDPMLLGTSAAFSATFADPGALDGHTAEWDWGDGSTSAGGIEGGTVRGTHTYAAAGVYEVAVTVTDDDGGSGTGHFEYYVVVYDPSAGFVTGGGWISAPAGSWAPDPSQSGKATFGFVSKYLKGAVTPSGQTQFQFKAGGLDFHSTSYQWLVVGGGKAQYKGIGVAEGYGECTFMLSALDSGPGGADRFRIRICERATGERLFDNQLDGAETADPTTVLGGGSVAIHRD